MIAIIDYGAGNIKSLQFALDKLGKNSKLTMDPEEIHQADSIILPGVGAFKDAMEALQRYKLDTILKKEAASGKPILGICLGMQLFYEFSEENGGCTGLGLLSGSVKRISDRVKVPHMGWNILQSNQPQRLLHQLGENPYVYFVHSYAIDELEEKTLVASADYGGRVPAIVQDKNITGMQFHPEKSGDIGIALLKNYEEMIS
ncbi:imidazole glycerol phosphate synthase subunit HisH [Oceanobacillus oncorhynchi subsp. incaldanensis]|uniref:Imidazole glycerol phosphate synthase subunit HisH n=2 Tax=Oceanobacillus TaxID=182709 RepID=A0A0A1MU42_9BACI|nr:imidazole glycerol phosphate synthase subunit HisH [Oceanobacillus oncorhynchi]MDM8100186.1 imidazole glycerol phosphate synthase subunit HisH [Oceanobacillus oncorhynchi]UUI40995.1 imidazole glycerol phosphate synthase subunit HisH [Oceanobacillus oncorhynchi]GIO19885.1 imidazole glycerol phosphate synthase subunit HisH [Oceanobacillus oncorhynchi subsp. incaldanensis]CEI82441.1 Imidazole glycerol phosphate synthase subunit HisH 1 [Oceanobacillus oncorhynchi]